MVRRIYVEKKPAFALEAAAALRALRALPGVKNLTALRLVNRYDVEGIDGALFETCKTAVFAEPQTDRMYSELDIAGFTALAVEYLPGQFDQRADSAAQCVQILSAGERPRIRTARVYLLGGDLTPDETARIRDYLINPVEAREAGLGPYETLDEEVARPAPVAVLDGFRGLDDAGLEALGRGHGLAMELDDLRFCRARFADEGRDPTETELKLLDTYWSDHCRHTTFLTRIDGVTFADELLQAAYDDYLAVRRALGRGETPVTLMDLGTIAARHLKAQGRLPRLDESEEVNACTVRVDVTVDGVAEPWLLLFKNETHNHPTEIEPFGGAATCIGGAIRDPLSGRSYVYAAMRVTGSPDPTRPADETPAGKLPAAKLTATAAAGYSSYGNQIGLCTGVVDELYHPGYRAKRMEIGAVLGAVPAAWVRREPPAPGDLVLLLGGRTGRDGCGGATGSSKAHDLDSLALCGAEVQKGNAPEERKLQRLFRNPAVTRLVKRCNDFGAGGVAVAIGELADGLRIDLGRVPKKYEGLGGTELAISESQERMAVVVAPGDAETLLVLAAAENLEATVVAEVTAQPRLVMELDGRRIVDLPRALLDSHGAEKHITIAPAPAEGYVRAVTGSFEENYVNLAADLNTCSKRGLVERFDSTIGAATVLMPYGGAGQSSPIQAMVHKLPVPRGETDTCSVMAWGFNPFLTERSPFHGGYLAVVESVCKLVAAGAEYSEVYLTFQEYFPRPGKDPARWGLPFAALLGAFRAQMALGVAAVGGKDSMSGSFEDMDVPPTLVSFAVTTARSGEIVSPEYKAPGRVVTLLLPEYDAEGLPDGASLAAVFDRVTAAMRAGRVTAARAVGPGGAAEAVMHMGFGNGLGLAFEEEVEVETLFGYRYGGFVLECMDGGAGLGARLGVTTADGQLTHRGARVALADLLRRSEAVLESVFPTRVDGPVAEVPTLSFAGRPPAAPAVLRCKPRVLIPVFPGTNCEYDTARAFEEAGGEAEVVVIRNRTGGEVAESAERVAARIERAQIVFLPGGFSAGDEPDGSGKFIAAFFRNAAVRAAVEGLLDVRGGLMGGICNGFQALIKLGLVPFGRICDMDADCPTLTFNTIGRHQSRIVRTRVASTLSPWLAETAVGEVYSVPISHGEGRFLASDDMLKALAERGQIFSQYVDDAGQASMALPHNPNGSAWAVEGITSPDGRVFGKMGHSERVGPGLYRNVPGRYDMGLFRAAVHFASRSEPKAR